MALGALPLAAGAWYVHRTAVGDSSSTSGTRKLEELPALDSLEAVGQLSDGGLHPGYAFPLWHGALAAVTRLSGVDAGLAVLRLGPLLTVLSALIAYGLGVALFRRWAGGALAAAFLGLKLPGQAASGSWRPSRIQRAPREACSCRRSSRSSSPTCAAPRRAPSRRSAPPRSSWRWFIRTIASYTALLLAGCLGAALLVRRGIDEATVASGSGSA